MIYFNWCACLYDANHNVPDSTIYHRQLSLFPKHTQPNRWWVFFSFSSSPQLITIYTSCTFNENGVKTRTLQSPPPWNNTILGVPIHMQFSHQIFKILQTYPMFNYLLWTFRTKPLSFHELLLLVLSFRIIAKSRNFVAATLFMFPHWEVLA